MVELIIFDWDDVFTHGATEGYYACYHQALEEVGVKLDPQEEKSRIKANWGKTARDEVTGLLQERSDLVDEVTQKYENILMGETFVNHLSVLDGASDFLKRLKEKYILSIATGVNPRLLMEKIMPKFNIPPVFSQILSVYDLADPTKAKPHPHMVEEILRTQGVLSERAILVGDARGDMEMARAAHVRPVAVLTGHMNRQQAKDLNIEFILNDVTELEKILPQL